MVKVVLSLLALLAIPASTFQPLYQNIDWYDPDNWETWKAIYGKYYEHETEENLRQRIFEMNKARVDQHNAEFYEGKHNYKLYMGEYSDHLRKDLDNWETWKEVYGKSYKHKREENFRKTIFEINKAEIAQHNKEASEGKHDFFLEMNHYGDQITENLENWENWKAFYGKVYPHETEENLRQTIYEINKAAIAKHNAEFAEGKHSYFLKMNHFGDLLSWEFVEMMNGFKYTEKKSSSSTFLSPASVTIPEEVDWRTKGAVTPVKDQGACGSCWAFSTTGSLEGQMFRKTGKLVSLSEQNLVDCAGGDYGNEGCDGGNADQAMKYIKDNGGIDTEKFYPYYGEDGVCVYSKKGYGGEDVGFVDIPEGDEQKLKVVSVTRFCQPDSAQIPPDLVTKIWSHLQEAVATIGPISVAIDASHPSFQFYYKGVYMEEECASSPDSLDHAVLVVGYGSENGTAYWLVKNSWAEDWGQKGYIKMARNAGNNCGIASSASYPLV